jgi:hypothetical protein
MRRTSAVAVAILTAGSVALAQDPEPKGLELKVVGPEGSIESVVIDGLEAEIPRDLMMDASGTFVLGVEGQDEDAAKKEKARSRDLGRKQDDGTIVRDIDLGEGRRLRIVIKTEVMKDGKWKVEAPRRFFGMGPLGERLKTFQWQPKDPHGFDVHRLHDEARANMERAMHAFERAREEFVKAYAERDATVPVIARDAPEAAKAPMFGVPSAEAAPEAAEARTRAAVEAHKRAAAAEKRAAAAEKRAATVQVLDVAPGAHGKHQHEVEELRKEVKELRDAVRELREHLEKLGRTEQPR